MSPSPAKLPDTSRVDHDLELILDNGLSGVLGIDEVGRGCLAGPLTVCGVWLTQGDLEDHRDLLIRANDSKSLTERRREAFYKDFMESPLKVRFIRVSVDAIMIDESGMGLSLKRSVEDITASMSRIAPVKEGLVLMDGDQVHLPGYHARAIVKGDTKSCAIACASILAKVWRDEYMGKLDVVYPGYGWAKNAGYGTPIHIQAIHDLGITHHHRHTFEPIKSLYP